MKILLIIPNLGSGGAQRVFLEQLSFYSGNFEVTGCVFNWDGAFESDRLPSMVSLDVPGGGNVLVKAINFFRRIRALRKLKDQFKPDYSISHLEGADYINIASAKTDKTICWIHGTKAHDGDIAGLTGWFRKSILLPFFYSRSGQLVSVSEGIRQELLGTYRFAPGRIKTIVNGFDVNRIGDLSRGKDESGLLELLFGCRYIIAHGRLARQKNLAACLDILASISKDSRVPLVLVGDGDQKDKLLLQCAKLGLSVDTGDSGWRKGADVYFAGRLANPFPLVSHAWLYIMTSLWEGFPLALCEAMACGVPVIAADCPHGPREILVAGSISPQLPYIGKYGVLMPLATRSSLYVWTTTLANFIRDDRPLQPMREAARLRIRDFDAQTIRQQWLSLLYA